MRETYRYENLLRRKAEAFIKVLIANRIDITPEPIMFRDYIVRLALVGDASASIYYSPKKNRYTLQLHGVKDQALLETVQMLWSQFDTSNSNDEDAPTQPATVYRAYVDGSFIQGRIGYGAVILRQGTELKRFAGTVAQYTEQRQIAGELIATQSVVAWCEKQNITEISIYYDYVGIEKWATNQWRAHNSLTQSYKRMMRRTPVNITWYKVKGHSGNYWNDVVDQIARQAALHPTEQSPQN